MRPQSIELEKCLSKIFQAPGFANGQQLRNLLRYLVNAALSGNDAGINGNAIAAQVFGRPASFDPRYDSIVRVQAGRLRKALEEYYSGEGRDDHLRILIPKGGYKVEFGRVDHTAAAVDLENSLSVAGVIKIGVLPFACLSSDLTQSSFADALSDELIAALARVNAFSLAPRFSSFEYRAPSDAKIVGAKLGVHYLVDGSVQQLGARLQVDVELIKVGTGAKIWTQSYNRDRSDDFELIDELIAIIIADLRPQIYQETKRDIEKKPHGSLAAWELFFLAHWTKDQGANTYHDELARLNAAYVAVKIAPNSGQAHSVLADKLSFLANNDPKFDTEVRHKEAAYHANKAAMLTSRDADVSFNLAMYYLHTGKNEESLRSARHALGLEPNNNLAQVLVKMLPYIDTTAPQETIDDLHAIGAAYTPEHHAYWVLFASLGILHLNNGEFLLSKEAAQKSYDTFKLYPICLQMAAAMVQLGEEEAAMKLVAEAQANWPNGDVYHYANVTIPRRYKKGPIVDDIQSYYLQLADLCNRQE
ncbi:MAG: hypothetical protein JKY99_09710 [Rhizobiales bacterium]|nr:hypothetical protein [Hyphomicrobiales bacterium]